MRKNNKHKINWQQWVLLIISLCFCIIVAVFFFLSKKEKEQDNSYAETLTELILNSSTEESNFKDITPSDSSTCFVYVEKDNKVEVFPWKDLKIIGGTADKILVEEGYVVGTSTALTQDIQKVEQFTTYSQFLNFHYQCSNIYFKFFNYLYKNTYYLGESGFFSLENGKCVLTNKVEDISSVIILKDATTDFLFTDCKKLISATIRENQFYAVTENGIYCNNFLACLFKNKEEYIQPKQYIGVKKGAFAHCDITAFSISYPTFPLAFLFSQQIVPTCLKSIEFYDSPTQILVGSTFIGCDYVEKIILCNDFTEIEEDAFIYCKSIKSIILPCQLSHFKMKQPLSNLHSIYLPKNFLEKNYYIDGDWQKTAMKEDLCFIGDFNPTKQILDEIEYYVFNT